MQGIQKTLDSGVLKINFDLQKGLELIWNFKGQISNCNYYSHLFIVGCESEDIAQHFIESYYKKMKNGDTFAIIYTGNGQFKAKWIQKTDFSRGLKFKRTEAQIQVCSAEYLLDCYLKKVGNVENLIVNIISAKTNMKFWSQKVRKLRQKGQLKFLVNLFGQFKHEIQVSIGLNLFELLQQSSIAPLANFLKWYYSQIVIKQAQTSIECLNASISPQNNSQWQSFSFNKIKKRYYAITRNQITDEIIFIPSSKQLTQYQLRISIRYKKLSGDVFQSQKVTIVNAAKDNSANRTRLPNQFLPQYFLKGINFRSDPYQKETFVWVNMLEETQSQHSQY